MRVARGAVTSTDDVNSWLQDITGLLRLKPPRRAGRAKRSLSASLTQSLPVRAGMNLDLMASSRGCRRSAMSGTVRRRYVHLLDRP